MEEKDLKKAGIELFSNQPQVKTAIAIVDNGEMTTAMVAGQTCDIISAIAGVMADNPQVRKFFEVAYLEALRRTRG